MGLLIAESSRQRSSIGNFVLVDSPTLTGANDGQPRALRSATVKQSRKSVGASRLGTHPPWQPRARAPAVKLPMRLPQPTPDD